MSTRHECKWKRRPGGGKICSVQGCLDQRAKTLMGIRPRGRPGLGKKPAVARKTKLPPGVDKLVARVARTEKWLHNEGPCMGRAIRELVTEALAARGLIS